MRASARNATSNRRPRLLLTRDAAGCARWADRLNALGAEPVALPCLDIVPSTDPQVADALITALADARWLALTSRRGVDAVAAILDRAEAPWPSARIAVVGPATAARAREVIGRVDLQPERATAADLALALWQADGAAVGPIVLATADRGRRDLDDAFGSRGVEVRRIEVYSTRPASADQRAPDLDLATLDGAFLASPSAVRGLLNQIEPPAELPLLTLGPTTSAAVRQAGLRVAAEAERPTVDALYDAFLDLAAKTESSADPRPESSR